MKFKSDGIYNYRRRKKRFCMNPFNKIYVNSLIRMYVSSAVTILKTNEMTRGNSNRTEFIWTKSL